MLTRRNVTVREMIYQEIYFHVITTHDVLTTLVTVVCKKLIPGDLVFIQPDEQDMSIIICAYRIAIK